MGMYYGIKPNKNIPCKDIFPEGLSNFMEKLPFTDYNSEVRQVSQILDINLEAFHIYYDGTNDSDSVQEYWQNIDTIISIVDSLINKIEQNKDYFKQVRYIKDAAPFPGN